MPRGLVAVAAPFPSGCAVAPPAAGKSLPPYPEVSVDIHRSECDVDLIGELRRGDRIASCPTLPRSVRAALRVFLGFAYLVGSHALLESTEANEASAATRRAPVHRLQHKV